MATVTVNGGNNRAGGGGAAGEGGTLNCGNWRRDECNSREKKKYIRKIKSQTKIKVLKVNNANWHFASRQAEKKRLKKTARKKKPRRKMFCCKTTTATTTAASPAGRQSKMTVAVISQFSVFGFRFWVLGFWILRLGWKSESIKVTKWLNFGVRQSALNVRCLPVACCMLHVAHWLLTAWTFVANWQKKWKVSQHLRARSCKHS